MDDLLREFVTETNESLDVVDVELVRFQRDGEVSLIVVPAGSPRAILDEVLYEWAPGSRLVEVH